MPVKLKTNRGAAKRFKRTGSGKYTHKSSHRRHILTKKSPKRKRQLRGNAVIKKSDNLTIKRMINK
jgi:large subunit ribosomal protein L35